ncbi:DnaJ-class molecular chaperone [Novosphingobium gossypii]
MRAYLLQTHEMLFDALTQAFRVLGGVPQRGIFDNMRTAVDKIGTGKARQVNARFSKYVADGLRDMFDAIERGAVDAGHASHQTGPPLCAPPA